MTHDEHFRAMRSARDDLKTAFEHCCAVFEAARKAGLAAECKGHLSLSLPPGMDPSPPGFMERAEAAFARRTGG